MNHTIQLHLRQYPLHYSLNALCCLEEKTGLRFQDMRGEDLRTLRALLWCGMMDSNPSLTLEETGMLLERHLMMGGSLRKVA